jgi:hypothetical protein
MFRVIATVGSMPANNDDVPNEGMVTVNRSLELGIEDYALLDAAVSQNR